MQQLVADEAGQGRSCRDCDRSGAGFHQGPHTQMFIPHCDTATTFELLVAHPSPTNFLSAWQIHCERRDLTSQLADLRDALIRCSTNAHGLFGVKWADVSAKLLALFACGCAAGGLIVLFHFSFHHTDAFLQIAICVCVEAAQLFNHSCYPNVILDYHSSLAAAGSSNGAQTTLVFRTLRPVSPGEQLLVSYAVCRQPRRARQAYLSRTLW